MNTSEQFRHNQIIPEPTYERTPIRPTTRGKRVLGAAGVILAGLTFLGGAKTYDAIHPDYIFIDKTTVEVAEPGDTEWEIANRINGVGTLVPTEVGVKHLRDTNIGLKDGLQVGESVVHSVAVEEVKE